MKAKFISFGRLITATSGNERLAPIAILAEGLQMLLLAIAMAIARYFIHWMGALGKRSPVPIGPEVMGGADNGVPIRG